MLTTWQDVYKDVRQKIEASGRDQRWEFDRKRLFERTDYMANICQNLYDIAQVSGLLDLLCMHNICLNITIMTCTFYTELIE